MYIHHITLANGHLARTQRADVSAAATQLLTDWLPTVTNTGRTHPLPVPELAHYSAQVLVQEGALVVTVSAPAGPHQVGRPHAGDAMPLVTFGVAQRSRQGAGLWRSMVGAFGAKPGLQEPGAPWLAVAVHPTLAHYRGATDWLADFERCVAWAWITRRPGLEAV